MSKFGEAIKHELREAVFPTLFFLVMFHLLALSKALLLESYSISATDVTIATVGALIVAKVILIFDGMAFTQIFSGRPLVYGVLWKSVIYSILVMLFRIVEEVLSGWSRAGSAGAAFRQYMDEVTWMHFVIVQIWMLVALFLYNSIVELDNHYGSGSMKQIFLGKAPQH